MMLIFLELSKVNLSDPQWRGGSSKFPERDLHDTIAFSYLPEEYNLALHKPAFQLDVTHGGDPSRAVDGNSDPEWGGGSCTHTSNQKQSWWAVDLGKKSVIRRVVIKNRKDCCCKLIVIFY